MIVKPNCTAKLYRRSCPMEFGSATILIGHTKQWGRRGSWNLIELTAAGGENFLKTSVFLGIKVPLFSGSLLFYICLFNHSTADYPSLRPWLHLLKLSLRHLQLSIHLFKLQLNLPEPRHLLRSDGTSQTITEHSY